MRQEHEPEVLTVTFLCTDIVGSTQLWQENGALMRERLAWHDALVWELSSTFGGDLFKARGDGFFVAFPTALAARDMMVRLQQAVSQEFGEAFQVRTVLSTGEAQRRDNDYFGLALSRASRVLEISHGRQLVLTETSAHLIEEATPARASQLVDLGTHQLRSLERPERLFQLLVPGLPIDFPALAGAALPPHNLPHPHTTFISREKEYATVEELLQKKRLVTLLGTGGSGKTRLALKVGEELLLHYPEGVWFVDLAPLTDEALLPRAVAAALRVREEASIEQTETLVGHLQLRKTLLILDNCEHVVGSAAKFVNQVLTHCPDTVVLATSREALGLLGETLWTLPGLSLPPEDLRQPKRLLRYEAIQLFIERAKAASPRFSFGDTNAACVARICRHLDGIPLALELAAAWISMVSLEQIEKRLEDRFRFLTRGNRTALPRQQTLRGALDWSHELLTPEEQALWRRLSVFAGSFSIESAEAVCGDREVFVLEALFGLIGKSLIVRDSDSDERYRLLETVREYGQERLKEASELAMFRLRHLEFFTALAEEAEPHLRGPEQKTWMDRLELEHSNICAALTRPESVELALRVACAIFWFWRTRDHIPEGRRFLSQLLSIAPSEAPLLRARSLKVSGILVMERNDFGEAQAQLEEAQGLFTVHGSQEDTMGVQGNLAILASLQQDYDRALTLMETCLAYYREQRDGFRESLCLLNLGMISLQAEQYDYSHARHTDALALSNALGDKNLRPTILHNLGIISYRQEDYKASFLLLYEAMELSLGLGSKSNLAERLLYITLVLDKLAAPTEALIPLIGQIENLLAAGTRPLAEKQRLLYDELSLRQRQVSGVEPYTRGCADGARWLLVEALDVSRAMFQQITGEAL